MTHTCYCQNRPRKCTLLMKPLAVVWIFGTPLLTVVWWLIYYWQKPNTEIALRFVWMNFELYQTDHLNWKIPFVFSIKICKNWKLPHLFWIFRGEQNPREVKLSLLLNSVRGDTFRRGHYRLGHRQHRRMPLAIVKDLTLRTLTYSKE